MLKLSPLRVKVQQELSGKHEETCPYCVNKTLYPPASAPNIKPILVPTPHTSRSDLPHCGIPTVLYFSLRDLTDWCLLFCHLLCAEALQGVFYNCCLGMTSCTCSMYIKTCSKYKFLTFLLHTHTNIYVTISHTL